MGLRAQSSRTSFYIKENLIRILIASYLMAVSVGIAPGPDLVAVFAQLMPETAAMTLGTAVMFMLAYAMMAGLWLRTTLLVLATMIVGTSFMENFILAETPDLGQIWQDIVVLCALLQNLIHLSNRQLRKTAILRRHKPVRRIEAGNPDPLLRLRTDPLPEKALVPAMVPANSGKQRKDDGDIANIFA